MRACVPAFVCILACCLCQAPALPLLAQERPPVIDMHLHADLPPYDVPPGTPALCRPAPCQGTGQATRDHDETLERTMMYQYPQLYADVSTISWVIPRVAFHDYLEAFVRAGLGKRLMFGSDQMRWPEKIGEGIDAIERAPFLTEEQKRDILHHNAVRFLRLEPELD